MSEGRQILHDLEKSMEDLEKVHGKEIHSEKWKRCVEHVKGKGDADNAYAVCTESLGDESFKSFAKSQDLDADDLMRIDSTLLRKSCEDLMEALVKADPEGAIQPISPTSSSMEDASSDDAASMGGDALSEDKDKMGDENAISDEMGIEKSMLVTQSIDMLYGNSPLPRPPLRGDLPDFGKNKVVW